MQNSTIRRCVLGTGAMALAASIMAPAAATPDTSPSTDGDVAPLAFGPKNVIHLVGDGMGFNQIDTASLYESGTSLYQFRADPDTGEVEQLPGEATQVYQDFPVQAAMSTYQVGNLYDTDDAWGDFDWVLRTPPDSAGTATALATGVRSYNGAIGVDENGNPVKNLTERAQELGKASGVVSSVPFSHATPGSYVAHNEDRNDYHGIAREMLTEHEINVIMGPGNPYFDGDGEPLDEPEFSYLDEPTYDRVMAGDTLFDVVEDRGDIVDLATAHRTPEHVFAMPEVGATLQYDRSGPDIDSQGNPVPGSLPYAADPVETVPTLSEMAASALNVLDNASDEGMFLMVEGGDIDWASHDNVLNRQIEAQLAFNDTVETVVDWVERNSSWAETLVVVTADHETGYLTGADSDPGWDPIVGEQGELPEISWNTGGHTNGLVPIFAQGPGASRILSYATDEDLVHGPYLDNTEVARTVFDFWGHD